MALYLILVLRFLVYKRHNRSSAINTNSSITTTVRQNAAVLSKCVRLSHRLAGMLVSVVTAVQYK